MAKARNPATVCSAFGIPPRRLTALGVLNSTLAVDTKLFVDPLLLSGSRHSELRVGGVRAYRSHFESIIRLLTASRAENDPAWKAVQKLLQFPEIPGTGLGYGAGSIHGSGFGPELTAQLTAVAAQIIEIGIRDPDLFAAMALFESGIGPDRLSDMTTNVVLSSLIDFNRRILQSLGLQGATFEVAGHTAEFLENPVDSKMTPVILLPTDILRNLPVAHDWDSIAAAASHNEALRTRVNRHVGLIWAAKSKRDKERLKAQAMSSKQAFETLLEAIRATPAEPYDSADDPEGLVNWAPRAAEFAAKNPLDLRSRDASNLMGVLSIVKDIASKFRFLVEHKGLNKELFRTDKTPRHESTAQRLFFAVAYSYCRANNIDVAPEIDTGNGKIDFKFSKGFDERVLVEVKLSTNPKVLSGYTAQLEVYKASEQTMKAIYLVIDVGRFGRKAQGLLRLRDAASNSGVPLGDLEFVDGRLKAPASRR